MGGWLSLQADAKWRLSKLLHLASWSGLLHAGHVPELVLIRQRVRVRLPRVCSTSTQISSAQYALLEAQEKAHTLL